MECEKARDQFSSLWEKELPPFEEKILREHLSSCPKCQSEFEQFEKTMQWLHSVRDVEVPEGFLPDLYKKIEERKGALPGEKPRGRWFNFPLSFKLPVQAVAMVAIVFLVLYLTKMMPMGGRHLKEAEQTSPPLSMEKKPERVLTQKEGDGERGALETSMEKPHPKDFGQAKAPVPGEEKREGTYAPQVRGEAKKVETPPPKTEIMAHQPMESKGAAREKTPSPEPGTMGGERIAEGKSVAALKPPQEIVLRISDREKGISQLHELVKQFGGEMVRTEGNMFLASLPTSLFAEFEKGLAGLSSSTKADQAMAKKQATGSLRFGQGVKGEEGDEKRKEPAKRAADLEGRTIVRILLIQE
jgi:hypothetical protein